MTTDNAAGAGADEGSVGVFRPAVPRTTYRTVGLFAIAARIVCEKPDRLDDVTQHLQAAAAPLMPPERVAATECHRLWGIFARVAQLGKKTLLHEAALALYRDLDGVAQRLDLPPLTDWDQLPLRLDEPNPVVLDRSAVIAPESSVHGGGESLHTIQQRAKQMLAALELPEGATRELPPRAVMTLLLAMAAQERKQLLDSMVGKGSMGRAEINLLNRYLLKNGDGIGDGDATLIEVLERIGSWLVASN